MVVVVDQRPLGQFITQLKSKLLAQLELRVKISVSLGQKFFSKFGNDVQDEML